MGVTRGSQFPELDRRLQPAVDNVGPFPRGDFLRAWWEELSPPGELLVVESSEAALVLVANGGVIEFAGDSDLTDYHSPLGVEVVNACIELGRHLRPGEALVLDSLPAEGSKIMEQGLISAGFSPEVIEKDVALVLDLPGAVDEFYDLLGKKDRHELRRKRRRYEAELGPAVFRTVTDDRFGIDEFIRLHKRAEGPKGGFMTPARERFFRRLAGQSGWQVDLLEADGAVTACLLGWSDDEGYYLYNSSYDPELRSASPGMVALMSMIESSINRGLRFVDFLKGNEPYKARLGARPRTLHQVEARR